MIRKLLVAFSLTIASLNVYADFSSCKFMFGTDWDWLMNNQQGTVATNIDYVTKWIVDANYGGVYSNHINYCKSNKKTPVYYSYIIAKAAALGDANVGGKLNTLGAAWLQNNINNVVNYYKNFASSAVAAYGDKPIIWLIEPDYFQYFQNSTQSVKLTYQMAGTYMGQIMDAIQKSNTKALFAADISPWAADQGVMNTYYKALPLSRITFMFTSGGESQANASSIKKDNKMTWSSIVNSTGKPIIADCGYGVGGGSTGHNSAWDDINNLNNRIANGVCAVTQKNPNGSWGISNIRSQLSSVTVKCYDGTPVIYQTEKNVSAKSPVNILTVNNGFRVILTSGHNFQSYSLINLDGRMIQSGKLTNHIKELFINGLADGMKFIRFEGVNAVATYPVAAFKD